MDLKFMDVDATLDERAAVDALLGPPETGWDGAERSGPDGHVAFVEDSIDQTIYEAQSTVSNADGAIVALP